MESLEEACGKTDRKLEAVSEKLGKKIDGLGNQVAGDYAKKRPKSRNSAKKSKNRGRKGAKAAKKPTESSARSAQDFMDYETK